VKLSALIILALKLLQLKLYETLNDKIPSGPGVGESVIVTTSVYPLEVLILVVSK
jgi:hypothetical protein